MNLEGIPHEDEEHCCRGYGWLHGCFLGCLRFSASFHQPPPRPAPLHPPKPPAKALALPTVSLSSTDLTLRPWTPALNNAIDGANTIITTFEPLLLIDQNNEVVPGQAELPDCQR